MEPFIVGVFGGIGILMVFSIGFAIGFRTKNNLKIQVIEDMMEHRAAMYDYARNTYVAQEEEDK